MLDDDKDDKDKGKKSSYFTDAKEATARQFEQTGDRVFDVGDTIVAANKATVELNKSLGGSGALASTIGNTFVDAGQKLLLLTDKITSLEEGMLKAAETNKTLMDETGRAYIASADELAGIIASQEASGVEASKLITAFKGQAYALEGIPKTIQKVIDTTRQLGVNSAAVTELVVSNLGKLNTYNFANGVEGLTRMAAQSAVIGVDMSRIFSIADDMFDPEKAVNLASSLQRLGVATGDLLDPLKLMDLGQNNPQELQNQIVEMSKRFTYFNEQNQKFEILPGAKLQLREVAKELGMNADELARMALGSSDLAKKMNEIRFPELETGPLTEDQRTMIANLSEMKDGEYKIKIQETAVDKETGERRTTGRVLEKSTAELSAEDFKSLEYTQKEGTKTLEQIALESMSYEKRVANAVEALVSSGRGALATSRVGNKGQELLANTISDLVGLTKESITAKGGRDLLNSATPALRKFGEEMIAAYKDGKISEDEKKQLMKTGKGIDEKFSKAFGKGIDVFKKLGDYAKEFPGEVMKALDAATENLEGQYGEDGTSSTKTKDTEPTYMKAQNADELMNGILKDRDKDVSSQQKDTSLETTSYEKTISDAVETLASSGRDLVSSSKFDDKGKVNTTNNTTTNTNYDQTFIDQTQKITKQMASDSNSFDLSPMVNLQGEQLTASKGSLTELQTLNSNINKSNETLISAMSKISEQKENYTEPTKEINTTIVQNTEPNQNTVTPEINVDPLADLQKEQLSASKNNFDLMNNYFSNKDQGDNSQLSKSIEEMSSKMINDGDLTLGDILPTQKGILSSTDSMVASINKMDENLISATSKISEQKGNIVEPTKEINTTIVQNTEPKQNTVTPEINMDPLADLQKDQLSLSKNNFELMSNYFSNKDQGDNGKFVKSIEEMSSKMSNNGDLASIEGILPTQKELLSSTDSMVASLNNLDEKLISAMSKFSEQKENYTEPTKEINTTIVQNTEPNQNTVTPEINIGPLADLQKDQLSLSKSNFETMNGFFSNKDQGDNSQLSKSIEEISSKMSGNGDLTSIEEILPTQKELLTSTDLMIESINKMDENLISYVSNLDSKDINKIEVKIPEQTGIESQKPTIEGNEQSVQASEMITNNITNNTLAQQMANPITSNQNNQTSFDGKLTIEVNVTAPPGVDTAAIKEVVTQTMYDSKVKENISKSVINPRIGSYNPTTGIPV
jgi:hypothetical protein